MKTYKEFLTEARHFRDWVHSPNSRPNRSESKFTDEESQYIRAYTEHPFHDVKDGSSYNINGYLRRRMDPNHEDIPHKSADIARIHHNVTKLSAAFRPETTNKEKIKLYSGIPDSEGEKFLKHKVGGRGNLAGFTSASDSKRAAASFNGGKHFLSIEAHPGTAINVGGYTPSYGEKESIIHHGAEYKYHGTERIRDGHTDEDDVFVHKISVYPTFKGLHGYPAYKDEHGREYK